MKIDRKRLRKFVNRCKAEGVDIAIGWNAYSGSVYVRGPLPWAEFEAERPWTATDDAEAFEWALTSRFNVCARMIRLALQRFALEYRYWPDSAPAPVARARLIKNPGGTWQWVILRCPYCRERHTHGGAIASDPHHLLAHHSERCEKPMPGAKGYFLVAEKSGPAEIRKREVRAGVTRRRKYRIGEHNAA